MREPVLFAVHNLLRDPPFSRLDLICCRNLLIYLDRKAQARALELFRSSLRPGGYLFLGTSESTEAVGDLFVPIDKKNRIFRVNPDLPTSRHIPWFRQRIETRRATVSLGERSAGSFPASPNCINARSSSTRPPAC